MLSIAMCTFNGEDYIDAQLQSFCQQTLLPHELIICDDGSHDRTIEKAQKFSLRAPFPVYIYQNRKALGPAQNFSRAISLCKGEYIALSDQDDVWLPDKLECEMDLMIHWEGKKSGAVLVHSDLSVVDESLQIKHRSMFRAQHLHHEGKADALKKLLVQNYVTGCTVLLNRALVEKAMPIPMAAVMHDWWLALIAAADGEIAFVSKPTVLYRQHGKNTIGAKPYVSFATLKKLYQYQTLYINMNAAYQQAKFFLTYKQTLFMPGRKLVEQYVYFFERKKTYQIYRLGIGKQEKLRNMFFYILLFIQLNINFKWKAEKDNSCEKG